MSHRKGHPSCKMNTDAKLFFLFREWKYCISDIFSGYLNKTAKTFHPMQKFVTFVGWEKKSFVS